MRQDWYEPLIRRLCESIGIPGWELVAQVKQIEVSGFPVALFAEEGAGRGLGLYVELTSSEFSMEPAVLRRLLESNITSGVHGYFCLVPGRGNVAYRTTIADADQLSTSDLMSTMLDFVVNATARLHEVMSQPAPVSQTGRKTRRPSLFTP